MLGAKQKTLSFIKEILKNPVEDFCGCKWVMFASMFLLLYASGSLLFLGIAPQEQHLGKIFYL